MNKTVTIQCRVTPQEKADFEAIAKAQPYDWRTPRGSSAQLRKLVLACIEANKPKLATPAKATKAKR
jgi:hypothetical protein